MGAVYVAQHVVIGRKAAIKVLRREFSEDVGLVARFMNEARAAAAIGHPNIVDVVDVGNLPDGTPYMMMEFLVGEDLSKRLAKVGRLSPAQALPIALQAGSAVAAAHEKGIVHRDLKPENLFLVQDVTAPGHERVKVLDFGIAKLRGDFTSGSQTKTGSLLGTPQYMSPEQCRGIPDGIDHRSDIYSFGIILYEMLCGAPPFVSEGLGDMLLMHLSQEPDLPSARNPEIPVWLERVILCALAKNPGDRFSTMGNLLAVLASPPDATLVAMQSSLTPTPTPVNVPMRGSTLVGGKPVPRRNAGPQSTLSPLVADEPAPTFVSGHRRGVVLGGAVAATVAVLLVVYLMFGRIRGGEPTSRRLTPPLTPSTMPNLPAVQPVVPPPVPVFVPKVTSPAPIEAKVEPDPSTPFDKNRPKSHAGRSPAGRTGKRPGGNGAAPRETPAETAEKW